MLFGFCPSEETPSDSESQLPAKAKDVELIADDSPAAPPVVAPTLAQDEPGTKKPLETKTLGSLDGGPVHVSDTDEPQQRDSEVAKTSLKTIFLKLDQYPHEDEATGVKHKSAFGVVGSLVAIAALLYLFSQSIKQFVRDSVTISRVETIRGEFDQAPIPHFGILIFADDELFYDETYFRFQFRYRGIFEGDANNDERPRIYMSVPSKNCTVYDSEKEAQLGCPDMAYLQKQLRAIKELEVDSPNDPSDFPWSPVMQGSYGQDAYLFMDINLIPCAEYGPNENITCATEGNVSALFDAGLNFDVVRTKGMTCAQFVYTSSAEHVSFFKVSFPPF
jgi:hypothetical protein